MKKDSVDRAHLTCNRSKRNMQQAGRNTASLNRLIRPKIGRNAGGGAGVPICGSDSAFCFQFRACVGSRSRACMPMIMGFCPHPGDPGDKEVTAAEFAIEPFSDLLAHVGLSISPLHDSVRAAGLAEVDADRGLWLNAVPDCAGRGTLSRSRS